MSVDVSEEELKSFYDTLKDTLVFLENAGKKVMKGDHEGWKQKKKSEEATYYSIPSDPNYGSCTESNIVKDVPPEFCSRVYFTEDVLKSDPYFGGRDLLHEMKEQPTVIGERFEGSSLLVRTGVKGMIGVKGRDFLHLQGTYKLVDSEMYFCVRVSIDTPSYKPPKKNKKNVRGVYHPSGAIFFRNSDNETVFAQVNNIDMGGWIPQWMIALFPGEEVKCVVRTSKIIKKEWEKEQEKEEKEEEEGEEGEGEENE